MKSSIIKVITALLFLSLTTLAQKGGKGGGKRGHGHGHHGKHVHGGPKVVVVKRSPYRPKKMIVYHPVWGPKFAIHRRWVFFPKYNMYWDNWRGCYFYWGTGMWISTPTPPPVVININLANEKHYELKENDDDADDVYKGNDNHKGEYKPE